MAVCQKGTMAINAGDQTKQQNQIQKYKSNKNLPNPVSTVIKTHTVISQYLFTSVDKMK